MQRTISSVTSLCDKWLTDPNITATTEQISQKKIYQHPLKRENCEVILYGRIAVKKPLLRKQNNVKGSSDVNTQKLDNRTVEYSPLD